MPMSATSDPQPEPPATSAPRQPRNPITYVPPPSALPLHQPANPNFVPRKSWPEEKYIINRPTRVAPCAHRWKRSEQPAASGATTNGASANAATAVAAPNGSGPVGAGRRAPPGVVNMHYAAALQLKRDAVRGAAAAAGANGGTGASTLEPGEVVPPAGGRPGAAVPLGAPRQPVIYRRPANRSFAAGRGGGEGSGGGSVGVRFRPPDSIDWPHTAGLRSDAGVDPAPRRAPSSGFAEGWDAAGKTLQAAASGAWRQARANAAVVAAMLPGDAKDAALHSFKRRIGREADMARTDGNAAYEAELASYIEVAAGVEEADEVATDAGWRSSRGRTDDGAAGGFQGRSVTLDPGSGAGAEAASGRAYVFRKGGRAVEVVGGSSSLAAAKKRRVEYSGKGSDASPTPKTVKFVGRGIGGGGSTSPVSKAQAPKLAAPKQASKPPTRLDLAQKLNMSLDALAGKPSAANSSRPAQAESVRSTGSGGKHKPIVWGA